MIVYKASKQETITRARSYSPGNTNETLIRSNNEEKVITIWRKFFNYSLNQSYYVDEDKTTYFFHMNFRTPKWMQKQLTSVCPTYSTTHAYHFDEVIFYEYDKNYLLSIEFFNPWDYSVNLKTQEEGLGFIGAYDMLNQKQEIMKTYKRFIQAFKVMNAEDIKNLIRQVPKDESVKLLREGKNTISHNDKAILININNLV